MIQRRPTGLAGPQVISGPPAPGNAATESASLEPGPNQELSGSRNEHTGGGTFQSSINAWQHEDGTTDGAIGKRG